MTADFQAALTEHLAALRARDIERFGATLGRDVVTIDGGAAVTRGTDAVLQSHAAWFAADDSWTFDYDVRYAREFTGAALALVDVTYRSAPQAEPVRFLLSLLFEREADGRYAFVFDQNTGYGTRAD